MADRVITTMSTTDTPEQVAASNAYLEKRDAARAAGQALPEDDPERDASEDDEPTDGDEPTEEEPAAAAAPPEHPRPKKKGETAAERRRRIQEEINGLTREKYKAQGELDTLRRQREEYAAPPPWAQPPQAEASADAPAHEVAEPNQADFASWEEYDTAWRKWLVKSRDDVVASKVEETMRARTEQESRARQEAAQRQLFGGLVENLKSTMADAKSRHTDYDAITTASADLPVNKIMQEAIMRSSLGGELMYVLCQRPDDCARIAQLSPPASLYELGKLEAEVAAGLKTSPGAAHSSTPPTNGRAVTSSRSGPAPRTPPITRAAEPITPLGSGATASTQGLDEMSYADYRRARLTQLRGG